MEVAALLLAIFMFVFVYGVTITFRNEKVYKYHTEVGDIIYFTNEFMILNGLENRWDLLPYKSEEYPSYSYLLHNIFINLEQEKMKMFSYCVAHAEAVTGVNEMAIIGTINNALVEGKMRDVH
jgi:hypothetical protein